MRILRYTCRNTAADDIGACKHDTMVPHAMQERVSGAAAHSATNIWYSPGHGRKAEIGQDCSKVSVSWG